MPGVVSIDIVGRGKSRSDAANDIYDISNCSNAVFLSNTTGNRRELLPATTIEGGMRTGPRLS